MERTTILMSAELRAKAKMLAKRRGVTLAALVRKALEAEVEKGKPKRAPIFEDVTYPRLPGMENVQLTDDDLYGPIHRRRKRAGKVKR